MQMIDILKQFKGVVDIPTEKGKLDSLYEQFRLMSKELLYGGYFLIEGKTRICLDDIEFYYHEEGDGGLKDPIMYHTNDHEGKEIPYFEIGRLNLHISGVDVTFENEEKKYRASFLIRGFHVENDDEPYNPCSTEIKNFDPCSTHIYDKMLYMGIPLGSAIEIEWVSKNNPENTPNELVGTPRKNVAEYEIDENGRYKKDERGKYVKEPQNIQKSYNKDLFFSSSNNIYKRCQRKWRFKKDFVKD